MQYVPNSGIESIIIIVIASKSKYDQEQAQSYTADQYIAPRGRTTEH